MSGRRTARWLGTVATGIVLAATALAGASSAAVPPVSHARLNGSTPAADSVAAQPPAAVVLSFNRDIAPPATVVVTAPDGERAGAGEPVVRGRDVSAPVDAQRQGTYVVAFRAVSVDGHPITGRFAFSVGHRSEPPTPATAADDRAAWWPWAAALGAVVVAVASVGLHRRRRTRPPHAPLLVE